MEKYGVDKKSQKDDMEKKAEEKRQQEKKEKQQPRQHIKEVPTWAKGKPKEEQEQIMVSMNNAAKELKSMFNGIFGE